MIVAGHICLDLIPTLTQLPSLEPGSLLEIGKLRVRPGGCVANTGRALAKAGVPVRLEADIGSDEIGGILSDLMHRSGTDISGLKATRLSTSYSIVIEAEGHDRTFWHHVGANAAFNGTAITFGDAPLLHVGYPSILPALLEQDGLPLERLLKRAREQGLTTSVDLAVIGRPTSASMIWWSAFIERIAPLIDIASPSRIDIESATGMSFGVGPQSLLEAARYLVSSGVAVAMVSGGAEGIAIATGSVDRVSNGGRILADLAGNWASREWFEAAIPVAHPSTTTGAGDAATASLLAALQRGSDPAAALRGVVTAAAVHISGDGTFALTPESAWTTLHPWGETNN